MLAKITTTTVAPAIDWVVVVKAWEVSAVSRVFDWFELFPFDPELLEDELFEEELLEDELLEGELLVTIHVPLIELYPEVHWFHIELLVLKHLYQFKAIQFFYCNFYCFLDRRSYSRNRRCNNKSEIYVSRNIRSKQVQLSSDRIDYSPDWCCRSNSVSYTIRYRCCSWWRSCQIWSFNKSIISQ